MPRRACVYCLRGGYIISLIRSGDLRYGYRVVELRYGYRVFGLRSGDRSVDYRRLRYGFSVT